MCTIHVRVHRYTANNMQYMNDTPSLITLSMDSNSGAGVGMCVVDVIILEYASNIFYTYNLYMEY
jgi:hypothetical protein